jgi:hypothetical protein
MNVGIACRLLVRIPAPRGWSRVGIGTRHEKGLTHLGSRSVLFLARREGYWEPEKDPEKAGITF